PSDVIRIDGSYEVADRASGIKALEKEIFRFRPKKHSEHDGITLINSASIYNEAETIASHVVYLLREKNYRLSDIKIICNDQTLRIPVLKRMLKEYGLDLFSDSAVNISDTAIVQYVLSMISAVSTNYYSNGILKVIKSGFTDLSTLEVMELENYAVKYRIRGNRWKEPFDRGVKEYGKKLEWLESLRVKAITPVLRFEEICKAETNGQFIDSLYSFLIDDVKFTERIEHLINRQVENGRPDLADESAQVFGYMTGILEQIREIAGSDPFDIADFLEIFSIGLSEVSVGALPPTKDGLILGTMERTRIGRVKSLIIFGANEGILPLEGSNEAVMSREERDLLKEKGFEILKTESVAKMEERLAIYRNFAKPLEELYITKSMGDAEGKKINASSVYTEILSIFGDEIEKKDILNSGNEKDLVSPHTAGLRHLTAELRKVSEGKTLSPEWEKVLDWYKLNDRNSLDAVKRGILFTNEIEPLESLKAKLLYTKGKEDISFGPTSVEGYMKCPFRFFLEKGLSLEERRIYEASSREIGDFSHLIVMDFTKRMKTEGVEITDPSSRWMTITPEEIREEVDAVIEEKIEGFMEDLFAFSDTEKYQAERMKNALYRVCEVLVYQVRCGAIKEIYFEESFGREKTFEPISFETAAGTVYIEGKIDRIDILSGDRVKIIDYKTGNNRFNLEEARSGYQIQLMLYLKAAEENIRKPGAVFYFHIQDGILNLENKKVDEKKLEEEIRKQYRMNGAVLNDKGVLDSIENDFQSSSSVMTLVKTKDGFKKNSGVVLSEEEFSRLEKDVTERITDAVKRMAEGDIRIYPSRMKSDGRKNACRYCEYTGICRFDGDIPGAGYNDL
ncbi:MAG: PD-(D/E)XK nuclease family protein, partial [Clostridia bacterium]|nr:PD-(D/E)XK nuclease family protein [Clostridia bacterium]